MDRWLDRAGRGFRQARRRPQRHPAARHGARAAAARGRRANPLLRPARRLPVDRQQPAVDRSALDHRRRDVDPVDRSPVPGSQHAGLAAAARAPLELPRPRAQPGAARPGGDHPHAPSRGRLRGHPDGDPKPDPGSTGVPPALARHAAGGATDAQPHADPHPLAEPDPGAGADPGRTSAGGDLPASATPPALRLSRAGAGRAARARRLDQHARRGMDRCDPREPGLPRGPGGGPSADRRAARGHRPFPRQRRADRAPDRGLGGARRAAGRAGAARRGRAGPGHAHRHGAGRGLGDPGRRRAGRSPARDRPAHRWHSPRTLLRPGAGDGPRGAGRGHHDLHRRAGHALRRPLPGGDRRRPGPLHAGDRTSEPRRELSRDRGGAGLRGVGGGSSLTAGTRAACCCGWGGAGGGAPWSRSGGCVRGSRRRSRRPLRA